MAKKRVFSLEENGTAVDSFSLIFIHGFGTRFRREHSLIAIPGELGVEKVVKLVGFNFLQSDEVGPEKAKKNLLFFQHESFALNSRVASDFFQNAFFPVLPIKRPLGAITIHLY